MSGDDYPDIPLAVAQRTLLWQPVKFVGMSADVYRNDHYSLLWRSTTDPAIMKPFSKD